MVVSFSFKVSFEEEEVIVKVSGLLLPVKTGRFNAIIV